MYILIPSFKKSCIEELKMLNALMGNTKQYNDRGVKPKGKIMNLNKIIMMGNLTRDPESKQFTKSSEGQLLYYPSFCKFGIAVNRKSKTTDEVCFVDVIAWGQLAEVCQKYLTKGKPVLVEGRLKLWQWEKDGKQNSKHVIILENMQMISEPKNKKEEGLKDDVVEAHYNKPIKNDLPF